MTNNIQEPSTPAPTKSTKNPEKRLLSEFETENLLALARSASKVRRNTRQDHPARQSARILEKTLLALRSEGVTVTDLASACGVTRRAVQQRLEKYL